MDRDQSNISPAPGDAGAQPSRRQLLYGAGAGLGLAAFAPVLRPAGHLRGTLDGEGARAAAVIRVMIRNGFTPDLADLFLTDLDHHWRTLSAHPNDCPPLVPEGKRQSFAH